MDSRQKAPSALEVTKGNMNNLVIGRGEVGTSVYNVLKKKYDVEITDLEGTEGKFDVMHVCFPYSDKFTDFVKEYQEKHEPDLTIIHSTVPVGTSDKVGAVHSPIRGVHPHLEEGIRTFVKYFGGKDAQKAAKLFRGLDIRTVQYDDARITEAGKIWSTTYYGWNIIFNKLLHKWCEENNLPFSEVYRHFNITYNNGYRDLGMKHVVRPVLDYMEGPIGGHCVLPNTELIDSPIAKIIQEYGRDNLS